MFLIENINVYVNVYISIDINLHNAVKKYYTVYCI